MPCLSKLEFNGAPVLHARVPESLQRTVLSRWLVVFQKRLRVRGDWGGVFHEVRG